ncbi:hypothetical protein FHU10_4241 [Serratia fonticola]|jgi:hypothetical protein|uniref:Antibiotic biosynthesis monooxygenase n=1 Tax=Serratia fonticola TaxID=47917 RepID=A0A542BQK4_SERFO|nr:hypothetical protein [Serratia fonticola]TQI80862.1 hypothetical protein FHU09_3463 [Serratia fonticola]TQI97113.1 hypothetical protein FHU11_2582 [Serratia fonticola]TVZ71609.1 hypothetical protein FHU10_4241 [Serratia fonticola]
MTIVRTAFFEADLTDEEKLDFYNYMAREVVPIIRTFPGNKGVVISKPDFIESDSHQCVIMMMQHSYENKSAMEEALSSQQRVASANATKIIVEKYKMRVHHMNFMVD